MLKKLIWLMDNLIGFGGENDTKEFDQSNIKGIYH